VPPHFLLHFLTSNRVDLHPEVLQSVFRPSPICPCRSCLYFFDCWFWGVVVNMENSCFPKSSGADAAADLLWIRNP
jgi:hypothetical protein